MQAFRSSRAPAATAWFIAAGAALAGCQPADTGNTKDNVAETPAITRPAPEPVRTQMNRETLLLAVARAASALTTGTDDSAEQRELAGQAFEFTIRFGCGGAAQDLRSAALGWSYQPDEEILRLRAAPSITAIDSVAAKIGGEEVEAVEGFWVPLPWVLQATCPPAETPQPPAAAEPAAKIDQTAEDPVQPSLRWPKIGIAQFFVGDDARTRRRDRRAYETVSTVKQGPAIGAQGFNLVLAGRLRPAPGKRVVECVAAASNTPPDCIVSADIDEVRMEKPEDGSVLARWSS